MYIPTSSVVTGLPLAGGTLTGPIYESAGPFYDLGGFGAVGNSDGGGSTGANDTTAITNALAAASAAGGGVVRGEVGKVYRTTGLHTIPKNTWVTNASFNHTGNNSCFTYDGQENIVASYSDDRVRGGLQRCRLFGNSGSSAIGVTIKNSEFWAVYDTIIGSNVQPTFAYTNGVAMEVLNDVYWDENLNLENVFIAGNATGIGYTQSGAGTNSLAYHRYRAVAISCNANQVGMDFGMTGGAVSMSNSDLDVNVWMQGNNATAVKVRTGSVVDDTNWVNIRGEVLNGSTGCLYVQNAGTFKPRGLVTFPFGSPLATTDLTGATATDLTGGIKSRVDLYAGSQNLVYEAFPIWAGSAILTMLTGQVYGELVGLKGGDVISKVIVFINGTSVASGLTLVKVALYNTSGTLLASSADNKANFTGNNVFIATSFTTPYVVPTGSPGGYYAAILGTGTTMPKLNATTSFGAGAVGLSPSGSGAAMCVQMTGQTDIPSPATFGGAGQPFYLAVA